LITGGGIALLVGLSFLLYQPYAQWYGLGYSKIDLWKGGHTPLTSYFVHWGVFLFVIVTWMIWETREWMADTPLSSLNKLRPYQGLILGIAILLVLATIFLGIKMPGAGSLPIGNGVWVAWITLPLAAWAGALLIRPGQPDAKRFVLFLIGTGLILTLMVELIVLRGDIGRMNTVFKFYLQVWTFFAISAAAAFGWLVNALPEWRPGWRAVWSTVISLLVVGALLYPITASRAKIKDRMQPASPRTLDGMAYMQYALYDWEGPMDLSQDYRAIRWLQENVVGSPVIVEANLRDLYRWGSRYSIYTGLPGVVGWEWHQQQQRALVPGSWISERIQEIDQFYTTTNPEEAQAFLNKYGVKYIIMGQLERNHYTGPGLDKFEALDGVLWREVYRDGDTAIYEVNGNQGIES
jgi:YYY domain-containing protein